MTIGCIVFYVCNHHPNCEYSPHLHPPATSLHARPLVAGRGVPAPSPITHPTPSVVYVVMYVCMSIYSRPKLFEISLYEIPSSSFSICIPVLTDAQGICTSLIASRNCSSRCLCYSVLILCRCSAAIIPIVRIVFETIISKGSGKEEPTSEDVEPIW